MCFCRGSPAQEDVEIARLRLQVGRIVGPG